MSPDPNSPNAPLKKDYDQLVRHFQNINASNITNTLNFILTLAVGVLAFAVNLLVSAKDPLGAAAARWLIAGGSLLFASVICGIVAMFNRIEDYRCTILGVVMERNNPGLLNSA